MDSSVNIINWFEVSVSDIARAKKFYEAIFSIKMGDIEEMMGMQMSFFPFEMNGKISGGLVQSAMHKPSTEGVKIYFNGKNLSSTKTGCCVPRHYRRNHHAF